MTRINNLSGYDDPAGGDQLALQSIIQMAENDYLEVWVENATDGDDVTVSFLNVIAIPAT